MNHFLMSSSFLILEDGSVLEGDAFGHTGKTSGELVFTTVSAGYQEQITDPSYEGQILMFTYPLVGDYGFTDKFNESPKAHVSAVVVREYCKEPSTTYNGITIDKYLKQQKVVGDSPVFELSASVGSKVLHNEMKGTVVTVPYVLEGGNAADLCVWFMDDDGNIEKAKDVTYNAEDKTVTFTVEHFSKYAIGFGLTSYVPEDDNTVMVLAIIAVIVVAFTAAMLLSIRRIEKQSL